MKRLFFILATITAAQKSAINHNLFQCIFQVRDANVKESVDARLKTVLPTVYHIRQGCGDKGTPTSHFHFFFIP